jgi:hypothetical protein
VGRKRKEKDERDIAEAREAGINLNTKKNMTDPFARRDTRPKILWLTGKKLDKATAGDGEGEEESKAAQDGSGSTGSTPAPLMTDSLPDQATAGLRRAQSYDDYKVSGVSDPAEVLYMCIYM